MLQSGESYEYAPVYLTGLRLPCDFLATNCRLSRVGEWVLLINYPSPTQSSRSLHHVWKKTEKILSSLKEAKWLLFSIACVKLTFMRAAHHDSGSTQNEQLGALQRKIRHKYALSGNVPVKVHWHFTTGKANTPALKNYTPHLCTTRNQTVHCLQEDKNRSFDDNKIT